MRHTAIEQETIHVYRLMAAPTSDIGRVGIIARHAVRGQRAFNDGAHARRFRFSGARTEQANMLRDTMLRLSRGLHTDQRLFPS